MSKAIKLSKEKREEMIGQIKNFYMNDRDEQIGDLAAEQILDFFIDSMAAEFYNQGVYDSQAYMNNCVEDLLGIQILNKSKR